MPPDESWRDAEPSPLPTLVGSTDQPDRLSTPLHRLVTQFAAMMRSVGARYRLSDADIDDLVQEVRIRLWRSRPTSELLAAVGASYMYRTAVTAALVVIRRRRAKTHGRDQSLDERNRAIAIAPADPERDLARSELDDQVERALAELPSSREVVRMYLAGYSREEIAELLGWSEAKTRNVLYRGLTDLRSVLTERGVRPDVRA